MDKWLRFAVIVVAIGWLVPPAAAQQAAGSAAKPIAEVATDWGDGVVARLEGLHRVGNALVVRFAVHNGSAGTKFSEGSSRGATIDFAKAKITDLKQNKKYEPMKAGGRILAGPMNVYQSIQTATKFTLGYASGKRLQRSESVPMWIVFPAPPEGAGDLTIEIPPLAFDSVPASAITPIASPVALPSSQAVGVSLVSATLTEANRAGDRVTVKFAVKNGAASQKSTRTGAYPPGPQLENAVWLNYADAALLDLQNLKLYGPIKETATGKIVARPMNQEQKNRHLFGGSWGQYLAAGEQATVSMSFQAPPASVSAVFLYVPEMPMLFEHVRMTGQGVETTGGAQSISGAVKDLDGALKDLGAKVTDKEIQISLASDVLFDFDKSEIRPDAASALKNVAVVINANPGGAVRIEGHTDSAGTDDYNLKLSDRRAESVKAWLVSKEGVDEARLVTRGLGESKPVASNSTKEGQQKNRRVEIVVARTQQK